VIVPLTGTGADPFGVAVTPAADGWTLDVAAVFRQGGWAQATFELRAPGGRALGTVHVTGTGMLAGLNCGPGALNFGTLLPGGESHLEVVCRNFYAEPRAITGVALDPSSHGRFTWTPNEFPLEVPGAIDGVPGEVRIDVRCYATPEDAGHRLNGILVLTSDDPMISRIDVQMSAAVAAGPGFACSPEALDFGIVAQGLPATRSFVCANIGTDRVFLDSVAVAGSAEYTAVIRDGSSPDGYAPGATVTVDATYAPVDQGVDRASVLLHTSAAYSAPVALEGHGVVLPPCDVEVAPAQLRFGLVEKDHAATLEFAIRNRGLDAECLIRDVRLSPTCDRAFSLPGGALAQALIPPGGERRIPVGFLPTTYTSVGYDCEVLFEVSKPSDPHQVVPVRGACQESCLALVPNDLDFGVVQPGCATRDRELAILNVCSTPVSFGTVEVGDGPTDEFALRAAPPSGFVVQPGASATVTVAYAPVDEGADVGSVLVSPQGSPEPLLVTQLGRAALDASQTDRFTQLDTPKADVLWVIDNSAGMGEEQATIAGLFSEFVSFARAQSIDYQIGVTTTGLTGVPGACAGGVGGGEDGRLFPVDHSSPRILTPATPSADDVWAAHARVGECQAVEQPLEAAYRALYPPVANSCNDPRHPEPNDGNCGFLRPDAHLSVIAVTDEQDQSPQSAAFYADAFLALKGARNPQLFNFHAITGDRGTGCNSPTGAAEAGDKLIEVAERTEGGLFRSICAADWASTLRDLSAAAFGFQTCFSLTGEPEDTNANGTIEGGELALRLDGVVFPSRGPQGQVYWDYRPDQHVVCFGPLTVPEPGAQIEVDYRNACL
jgi:hypothetical protein